MWRAMVEELAGPDADLQAGLFEFEGMAEFEGMVGAQVLIPGALQRGFGWEVIEEVIDQATYVVASDPAGSVWAIGVASDGYRRGYLEPDMARDDRAERVAFIDPIDTRSPEALTAALEEEV